MGSEDSYFKEFGCKEKGELEEEVDVRKGFCSFVGFFP